MGTILVIDGKPRDIDTLTPSELAKATRDILSEAQRRSLNTLTPEQCVGRYIDYLSVPEKRQACATKTIPPTVLARIESRIRAEAMGAATARGGEGRSKPKGYMGGKRRTGSKETGSALHARANVETAEDAIRLNSQIKSLLEYCNAPRAAAELAKQGCSLPLSALSLTRDMPVYASVGKLNGYYQHPNELEPEGLKRWNAVQECIAFLSRSVYAKEYNYNAKAKAWGIHPYDADTLSAYPELITLEGTTPKAARTVSPPAATVATPREAFKPVPNEGEAIRFNTPKPTRPEPVEITGDISYEGSGAKAVVDEFNKKGGTLTIGGMTYTVPPAETVSPPAATVATPTEGPASPAHATEATKEDIPHTMPEPTYTESQCGPTNVNAFLTPASNILADTEKSVLQGTAEGTADDFAAMRTAITAYFDMLTASDPTPVKPKVPEESDFPSLIEWSEAVSAMGPKLVAVTDQVLQKQARDHERVRRAAAIIAQIDAVEKGQGEKKARAEREAAAKARAEAAAESRKEAASALADVEGMLFPTANPHFLLSDDMQALFKGLKRQLEEGGNAANVLLTGPAGTGKTSIAQEFAAFMGMGFVSVECSLVRDASSLFGHWTANPSEGTRFVPTQFTKAMQAGNCVILLDEANRFPDPSVSNGLLPLLDHRRGAWIDDIEQSIAFGPNIVIFATRNQGGKFVGTTATDAALESRFDILLETETLSVRETKSLLLSMFPDITPEDAEKIAKIGDAIRNAYASGSVSVQTAQREDIAAAKHFRTMGPNALRLVYANRFSADDLGGGAERTQINGIIQGQYPRY